MKVIKRITVSLIAALLLSAISAMAGQTVNVVTPISGALISPCNGATITYSGSDHSVYDITSDGAGGFHVVSHDNIHVTATDDQGNSYVGDQSVNSSFDARVGLEQTFLFTLNLDSQGSAPNIQQTFVQHFTVNANGTLTVFFTNVHANCPG